jgi:uncharacterized protein (TIGR02001 family)
MTELMMPFEFACSSLAGAAMSVLVGAGLAQASDLPSKKGPPPAPVPPAITWFDVAVTIKATTDYNFRGISQSDRKPAIQGGAELQFYDNLFYAGVWASSVDLATNPPAEIDLTAGIRPKFGPVTFDLGVIQYYYPAESRYIDNFRVIWTPKNTDFLELAGKVSYNWEDKLTLGANVFYSWNWLGTGATGTYVSGTAKYNLPFLEGLSVSGEFGRYWLGTTNTNIAFPVAIRLPDYNYWNVGLSYTWKNLTADIRYHDTNLSKTKCFTLTSDPSGITRGNAGGIYGSKWCNPTIVGSLSFDITASSVGIFAPAK